MGYADKNKCIYYCDNGGDAGEEIRDEEFKGVSKYQIDEIQKKKAQPGTRLQDWSDTPNISNTSLVF